MLFQKLKVKKKKGKIKGVKKEWWGIQLSFRNYVYEIYDILFILIIFLKIASKKINPNYAF